VLEGLPSEIPSSCFGLTRKPDIPQLKRDQDIDRKTPTVQLRTTALDPTKAQSDGYPLEQEPWISRENPSDGR
jgi:hypothetical protein